MSANQTRPATPFPISSQAPTSPPNRILVVEDDDSLRQLSTEVLLQSGYEVDAAEDGDIAWESLLINNYDLMITDQLMPRLTGVALLKKLRAARMALPVIMATGTVPQEEFDQLPWLLPAAILVKPYTIPDLLGVVREVLYATECSQEQFNGPLIWRGHSAPTALQL